MIIYVIIPNNEPRVGRNNEYGYPTAMHNAKVNRISAIPNLFPEKKRMP